MEVFLTAVATSSVVAGLVTLAVTRAIKRRDDQDLKNAIKTSIQIEVDLAAEFALAYVQPGAVRAPMHRITTGFYDENAAKLLALNGISEKAFRELAIYYQNIAQMNRSLELVFELQAQPERQREELGRTFIKACSLISIAHLKHLEALNLHSPFERKWLTKKRSKYGASSPYDSAKAAIA